MSDVPRREASEGYDPYLKGTTYRVYRLMLKQRKPVGISDLQRALGLSSPSVSEYHVKKLLRLGLIREEQGGYVIEKVVFDNIIRIRRISIPVQTAYVSFFSVSLAMLLTFLSPQAGIDSTFFLAVVVNSVALAISLYEMTKILRRF